MKEKEIGEIRRHIRRDRSNMTAIHGCFVSEGKEIISKFRLSTGMMPENEGVTRINDITACTRQSSYCAITGYIPNCTIH